MAGRGRRVGGAGQRVGEDGVVERAGLGHGQHAHLVVEELAQVGVAADGAGAVAGQVVQAQGSALQVFLERVEGQRALDGLQSLGVTAVGLVLAMLCDLFILSFLLLAFSGTTKGLHHAEDSVARAGALHAHRGAGS